MAYYPTCDNECTEKGWVEYLAECEEYDLHISVAPDTDLDEGTVKAFCHDEQEMITINTWLFSFERV